MKPKRQILSPIEWVVVVYGKSRLEYLNDYPISNDEWWLLMEEYGKYAQRKTYKTQKK